MILIFFFLYQPDNVDLVNISDDFKHHHYQVQSLFPKSVFSKTSEMALSSSRIRDGLKPVTGLKEKK